MRQKFIVPLVIIFLLCSLGGCSTHSFGSKNVAILPIADNSSPLTADKSMYLTITPPIPPDIADTPAFIATQFAKELRAVAKSIDTSTNPQTISEGLTSAKAAGADYLVLLEVKEWKKSSYLSLGQKAILGVTVINTDTEQIGNSAIIEASCYAMISGLEPSPRECIRPQIKKWMEIVFGVAVPSSAYTDRIRP